MARLGMLMLVVSVATAAMTLAGCGRKGPPVQPPPAEYPKTYPAD